MGNNQIGRDFLATAALLGTGLAVGSVVSAAIPDPPEDKQGRGAPMKTRKLGKLEVSAMGSGAMSISANYGPPTDRSQGIAVRE